MLRKQVRQVDMGHIEVDAGKSPTTQDSISATLDICLDNLHMSKQTCEFGWVDLAVT